ncbi:MAG: hypothetical protein U1F50_11955 [Rubrivivax sp.]
MLLADMNSDGHVDIVVEHGLERDRTGNLPPGRGRIPAAHAPLRDERGGAIQFSIALFLADVGSSRRDLVAQGDVLFEAAFSAGVAVGRERFAASRDRIALRRAGAPAALPRRQANDAR